MSGTGARVITAIVLIPLVVWLVLWGPTWLVAIVVAGIILLALHEFFALGAKMNMQGYPKFTMLCALLLMVDVTDGFGVQSTDLVVVPVLVELFSGTQARVLVVFLVGIAVLSIGSRRPLAQALSDGAISAAGLAFVAWPLGRLVEIHNILPELLLLLLVIVWAGDSAAFFVGRLIGKRPLAPQISPKKTREGAIANLLGSLLAGFVFFGWQNLHISLFKNASMLSCVLVAVLVSIAGQIGDLFESAWKRSAGVKDSGTLLPGHGGILDRVDAFLVAAPVFWWYFSTIGSLR